MIFQTSATNFYHWFSVSFLPVLYRVMNYPNTLFTRSFLAWSAHKNNKIHNKIQNIWFPLPTYSVLQLPKQCLRKKMLCCLTFVCVYIMLSLCLSFLVSCTTGLNVLYIALVSFPDRQQRQHTDQNTWKDRITFVASARSVGSAFLT